LKLLTRSTYYYFVFSFLVLVAGGIGIYFTIRSIVYRQIDLSLITEKSIIQDQIEDTDTIPDFSASFGHQIEVKLLKNPVRRFQVIRDTDIYDSTSYSYLPFRHIRYAGNTPFNTGYIINIYQTLDENQKLLDSIAIGMLFVFLTLLLVSILVNYLISKRLWKPFYKSLKEVSNFDMLTGDPLDLPQTNINEFRQLNLVLEQMTKKIRKDYLNLKEYNENSSHEIQTPLAVIRSKLDILMQNQRLNRESKNLIMSINDAVSRIFKLNQGLLLISKIENQQFPEIHEVSLKSLIEKILNNYEEIMNLRNIKVKKILTDPAIITMNEILADVLISNLLGNAIRYNINDGFIECRLDNTQLTITNSGLPLKVDPSTLFGRFRKGTDHPDAVGLGLSIVKKITDLYGMAISFSSQGTVHEIVLKFRAGQ